jgi:glucuronate isomerase
MKQFLDENFLLKTKTAQRLYHDYARDMPIIDYHCHLPPQQVAEDTQFENLTQAWLYGDHYKWRAMRINGVDESYCTGSQPDDDKFQKWAETVPYTLRNPLYHWTHLELQRYFDIDEVLNGDTAQKIYKDSTAKLQSPPWSVRNLLRKMNVSCAAKFNSYTEKLEAVTNIAVSSFDDFLQALQNRHDYFASMGCSVSDHGLEEIYADDFTATEIDVIFSKIHGGKELDTVEQRKFRSAMLIHFAEWDWEKGWVQQFHLGALRNNNSRMTLAIGPDTGWDSIGDFSQGRSLAKFLDKLDSNNKLAKTILYNLNPSDYELMATMISNFNDGSSAGKIQWGSAWWFLDQKDGMTRQINTLSNMGLLSRFVGMLTDSRSFLSFPRHEYFRRILCDLFGDEIENGELPNDLPWTGKLIQDICFNNNKNYFNWNLNQQPATEIPTTA